MRDIIFRVWDKEGKFYMPNVQNHIGNSETAFGYMLKNIDFETLLYYVVLVRLEMVLLFLKSRREFCPASQLDIIPPSAFLLGAQ